MALKNTTKQKNKEKVGAPEDWKIQKTKPFNTPNDEVSEKRSGFKYVLSCITVEPVALIALFANFLSTMSTETLGLDKTCRVSLRLDEVICDSLRVQNRSNNFTDYERIVQEHYSARLPWKSALQSIFSLAMLLFAGGWSDKTGRRKVIILIPIYGKIFQCISNILNVVFFYEIPLEALMAFNAFFPGITGGITILSLAMFNYICDITTAENRTQRLGFVNLCTFAGKPIGLALSGIMLRHFGYYAVYGSALTLHLLNVLYVTFRIRDPLRTKEQIMMYDNKGCCHFLKEFFDPKTVENALKVLFKRTENNRRLYLGVLVVTACLLYGPILGEISVLYLFIRFRFNWNEMKFTLFQTFNFIVNMIGTIFAILVLSKHLKWHDALLGITSTVGKIVSSFVYCFAPNEKVFFLTPIVDILDGTAMLAVKSMYSKLVDSNEIGKLNSIVGQLEVLMPLMYVPMFTQLYTATMGVLPGAVFLLGGALSLPVLFVFIWLYWRHRIVVHREKHQLANELPLT